MDKNPISDTQTKENQKLVKSILLYQITHYISFSQPTYILFIIIVTLHYN